MKRAVIPLIIMSLFFCLANTKCGSTMATGHSSGTLVAVGDLPVNINVRPLGVAVHGDDPGKTVWLATAAAAASAAAMAAARARGKYLVGGGSNELRSSPRNPCQNKDPKTQVFGWGRIS